MKLRLPLSRVYVLIVSLIAVSGLLGWLVATGRYAWLTLGILFLLFLIYRLANVYSGFVRKLDFVFSAVRNNDLSFRFVDKRDLGKRDVVNYALNRLKETLDEAKANVVEKEKYFETIIECANIGILIIMENGVVMMCNRKALGLLGVTMLSHIDRLLPISSALVDSLRTITDAEQKSVSYSTEVGEVSLLLNCSSMRYAGKVQRVITIENINRELDRQEEIAWEKLTRILTHEIMNSLAPITSISHTLLNSEKESPNLYQGLEVIHSTGERLMQFVNSFRTVTRVPLPAKSPFRLLGLYNEIVQLIDFSSVRLLVEIEPAETMVYADRAQLSQVLVNLLKNAVEACKQRGGERFVEFRAHIASDERICIEIGNNGGVIPTEVADNIFTPFFTTKQSGSGIGLAVSRQIMRLHGGSLHLVQNSDEKVVFRVMLD